MTDALIDNSLLNFANKEQGGEHFFLDKELFESWKREEYFFRLSAHKQAMGNLDEYLLKDIPPAFSRAFNNIFAPDDPVLSFRILKSWMSEEKYDFDEIDPVSFTELTQAVQEGIKDYQKEFSEFSFLFDNSNNWNIEDAYAYMSLYRDSKVNGISTAKRLAGFVSNKENACWSVWRMSLKYITIRAKKYLYNLYKERSSPLVFNQEQRNVLTRWLYELARFPAGSISPKLLYKKIMLSYLLDKSSGKRRIDSGMSEGILYNLCFNLHASGLKTYYFGNYLEGKPKLQRSCHNYAAAKEDYIDIASSIDSLLKTHGKVKQAYSLKIEGKNNQYYAVMTNYQIIIIGIDPSSINGLSKKLGGLMINSLLESCLSISGFACDKKKSIKCEYTGKYSSKFEYLNKEYDAEIERDRSNIRESTIVEHHC